MIYIIIAALTVGAAWWASKRPERTDPTWLEIYRWAVVAVGWLFLGAEFKNLFISYFFTQSFYIPAFNYWSGKDIWFIDDDTWYGKLATKYLGVNAGRTLFYIQLAAAIILAIL